MRAAMTAWTDSWQRDGDVVPRLARGREEPALSRSRRRHLLGVQRDCHRSAPRSTRLSRSSAAASSTSSATSSRDLLGVQ